MLTLATIVAVVRRHRARETLATADALCGLLFSHVAGKMPASAENHWLIANVATELVAAFFRFPEEKISLRVGEWLATLKRGSSRGPC